MSDFLEYSRTKEAAAVGTQVAMHKHFGGFTARIAWACIIGGGFIGILIKSGFEVPQAIEGASAYLVVIGIFGLFIDYLNMRSKKPPIFG